MFRDFDVAVAECAIAAERPRAAVRPIQVVHPSDEVEAIVGGALKRAFDIALSLLALVLLAPILSAICLTVSLDSKGPIIFRQKRGGLGGQTFYIFKFRTMTMSEEKIVSQVVVNDPRVTSVGRFLRKTSLDELPQLFNVLKGDMSLIGPRPHAVTHDQEFENVHPRYRERQRTRPGITGLAQVRGYRGPTDTRDKILARIEADLAYVRDWSLALDLKIFVRTIGVFFGQKNAF